jgi:hypothetical protein
VLVTGYQLDCLARVHPRSREPSSSELYMRQMSGLTKGAHLEMYTGKQNLKALSQIKAIAGILYPLGPL